jgi:hypothetical protein
MPLRTPYFADMRLLVNREEPGIMISKREEEAVSHPRIYTSIRLVSHDIGMLAGPFGVQLSILTS